MRDRMNLVLAAIVGLGTAAYVYLATAPAGSRVPVVVAAQDIPPYTRIEAGMVRLVRLPQAAAHPDALRRIDEAVGQLTAIPIQQREQVLRGKLAGARGTGPAAALAEGELAMFIPVEGGHLPSTLLAPGQRTDLVFVAPGRPGTPGFARLLLSSLRILHVERERTQPFGDGGNGRLTGVVVAVRPDQAERIAYALEHGRIHLLAGGTRPAAGTGVTWENLFTSAPAASPLPAQEPPDTAPVPGEDQP